MDHERPRLGRPDADPFLEELINWINEVGFLPLFANEAPGFSAEEHVSPSSGGPAIPNRIPGSGARLFPRPGR